MPHHPIRRHGGPRRRRALPSASHQRQALAASPLPLRGFAASPTAAVNPRPRPLHCASCGDELVLFVRTIAQPTESVCVTCHISYMAAISAAIDRKLELLGTAVADCR